jgi:ribosome biogenesis GTPase / thiamine phosphate phosphatase
VSSSSGLQRGQGELLGTVTAVQANFYRVRLAHNKEQPKANTVRYLLCTRRTRLKKIGQKVMVGDRVIVTEPDWQDSRGAISEVLPRTTELQRPPVANADRILLVFAVAEPTLDPWQLSRFLVKAESTNLELCLCLNKCDLITVEQQQQWQAKLVSWGYEPILVSAKKQQGIERLLELLKDHITVVAGPSGVGKSSLINQLIPTIDLRVGEISGKLQRGRHTTRHVELFELPGGGLLADSPGFNQPDLTCEPMELIWYFPEAKERLKQGNCQFNDCLHLNEPNCVVRGDWERYEYYREFLEQAIFYQKTIQDTPDEEANTKLKVKRAGKAQYEPRLASKKYRRHSRRHKHQSLQDVTRDRYTDELDED